MSHCKHHHPLARVRVCISPLSVPAIGAPPPSYQWFKNGRQVKDATSSELVITEMSEASAGEYSVDVYNEVGTLNSAIARVKLEAQPPVITQHPADAYAVLGDPVVLTVKGTPSCCNC